MLNDLLGLCQSSRSIKICVIGLQIVKEYGAYSQTYIF